MVRLQGDRVLEGSILAFTSSSQRRKFFWLRCHGHLARSDVLSRFEVTAWGWLSLWHMGWQKALRSWSSPDLCSSSSGCCTRCGSTRTGGWPTRIPCWCCHKNRSGSHLRSSRDWWLLRWCEKVCTRFGSQARYQKQDSTAYRLVFPRAIFLMGLDLNWFWIWGGLSLMPQKTTINYEVIKTHWNSPTQVAVQKHKINIISTYEGS